ncbi:MAG: hypothetical protein K1X87_06840 [Dehalococcoidia bacterium]|nr:hypothetical protein [Dehalococcoidia bacterium]
MFEQAPRPVIWAAALTVFNAVVGFAVAAVWPDIDDRGTLIVVGGVLTLLMLGATLWLWRRAKWGGIAFIAINAVNALSALPALFAGDAAFAVIGVISALLSVAAIVFVLRPEAKPYWS